MLSEIDYTRIFCKEFERWYNRVYVYRCNANGSVAQSARKKDIKF